MAKKTKQEAQQERLSLVEKRNRQERRNKENTQKGYNLVTLTADTDKEIMTSYSASIEGMQDIDIYPQVSGRHISVDAPFVEGEDNSLLDVLVNDDAPIADRSLMNESLSKEIDRALATLTERESEIIKMFFGIGCQEMTLEEIGDKFGLTRERVRQIKEKAIRRLRQGTRSKLLKSYLG